MVRWHPMPPDLPAPIADFKRALREAINRAGHANLGILSQKCGIPTSTISDAASRADFLPPKEMLVKILHACASPQLNDARYSGWEDLHGQAGAALGTTRLGSAQPKATRSEAASPADTNGRLPLAVYRKIVQREGRLETTEILFYSEASVERLIDRRIGGDSDEAGDA
jgi:hypothetical protein